MAVQLNPPERKYHVKWSDANGVPQTGVTVKGIGTSDAKENFLRDNPGCTIYEIYQTR